MVRISREPFDRADKGQGDAGVAAGGLHDDGLVIDESLLEPGTDHAYADAVLDRAARVVELQLGYDLGPAPVGNLVQPHQWRVSDQVRHVRSDSHVNFLWFLRSRQAQGLPLEMDYR
jgi:hypothetical protein